MIKFEDMPYERPDLDKVKEELKTITEDLKKATTYEEANKAFLAFDTGSRHIETLHTIASIRYNINTKDEFYAGEDKFWNEASPELESYRQDFTQALLNSEFRSEFEKEYGNIMFINAEIALKSFSNELIPDLVKENELTQEYENLLANAKVSFEGKEYTLSQMTLFKGDADDERRLQAWVADGKWYKDNQAKLDSIYDELVHLRDGMGKKLGYEGYTTLGYYRMGRNCYDKHDVEKFRTAVQKYVVPVAEKIYQEQAKRLGKSYPMSFADNELTFRSGNPKPVGTSEDILNAGQKFYDELSPETSKFFRTMREGNLLDVLSKPGKRGGGYRTGIPDYHVPFIFANFNGTQGDVEVVSHEAGHAFEAWLNMDRVPVDTIWPSMEACEVHSMSMEFFAECNAEDFFGEDAHKFRYSHLAGAIKFIPYGTLVDHFQHSVYENPNMTPSERHAEWKRLMGIYMPWEKLDGEIPFYSEGEHWQLKHHIYSSPFYYIDYCLAQTVSLEFWAMIQENKENAWNHYMTYTMQGGSRTFTELLKNADLQSPFDENTLKEVCAKVDAFLSSYDMTGVE